jgi:ATP-dependent helicase/nuclease subunit A
VPEFNLTSAQAAAVKHRGGPLLISAGAGSGKTRVLVERLLDRVIYEGLDIDSFLVITYTRAAAAELRGRILEGLYEKLSAQPGSSLLRRQTSLVYKAQINTIHGFCSSILRENAHLCGIRPDFRQLDEAEEAVIKDEVLQSVINKRYSEMTEGFRALVDVMGAGMNDSALLGIVLDTHAAVQSHPYPDKWLENQINAPLPVCDVAETVWGSLLLKRAVSRTQYWLKKMKAAAAEISSIDEVQKAYLPSYLGTIASLEGFLAALNKGWDAACNFGDIDFPTLGRLRGFKDDRAVAAIKAVRELCKKRMKRVTSGFDALSAEHIEDIAKIRPCTDELFRLVLDFSSAYAAEKSRRGALDFSDLEHMALNLLTDSETGKPTPQAVEISERYTEILVDEYQDANRVQDRIFTAVSKNGQNITMVGDVKQSIYRFRLADPTIFLEKYAAFSDEAGGEGGRRIVLNENFRSDARLLEAVNSLFGSIMSREVGELDYGENERLIPPAGAVYTENAFELCLVETGEDERLETEAAAVASMIDSLLHSGYMIKDGGDERPIEAGDIAILLRSVKDRDSIFASALARRGISSVMLKAAESLMERREVSYALSILQVIDNPLQDISLIAALRSPVWGFTADELAQIRSRDKNVSFYEALKLMSETDNKCRRFLEDLDNFRLFASDMTADRLISYVYDKTHLPVIAEAQEAGSSENLSLLLEYARSYEKAGYRGLFGFVNQITEALLRDTSPLKAAAGGKKGVIITSIHSSKGLEYPVVILADLSKSFNLQDSKKPLLIHPSLGAGPKLADKARGIEYPTLPRLAAAAKIDNETLSEEMRVLYVAMTRAKQKLYAVCSVKEAEKTLDALRVNVSSPLEPQAIEDCRSVSDWVLLAALSHEGEKLWSIKTVTGTEASVPSACDQQPASPPRQDLVDKIKKGLAWRYKHAIDLTLPSKLTATQLKGGFAASEAAEEAEKLPPRAYMPSLRRPSFAADNEGLSSAEKGTSLHLVMQYIDYSRCDCKESIVLEIKRLLDLRMLTPEQASAVSPDVIADFFSSETGRRILSADKVIREFKFSMLVPASRYYEGGDGDILLQGVVDCYIIEAGHLTVLDYKTDRVNKDTQYARALAYKPQLEAYAEAMSRITGLPVSERLIYFFATGETIAV